MEEPRGSFLAHDGQGTEYVVNIFAIVTESKRRGGPTTYNVTGWRLQLENKMHVNRVTKGSYTVVDTGVKLTSNDPRQNIIWP